MMTPSEIRDAEWKHHLTVKILSRDVWRMTNKGKTRRGPRSE